MTTPVLNTKISKVEKQIPDNFKYITTQQFNKLMEGTFAARFKQADLVNKTDFDSKLRIFNKYLRQIKQNIYKFKLNSLITKHYNFFQVKGKIHFTSNDESENTFVYKSTLDTLELIKRQSY